jgi:hypothetical protein
MLPPSPTRTASLVCAMARDSHTCAAPQFKACSCCQMQSPSGKEVEIPLKVGNHCNWTHKNGQRWIMLPPSPTHPPTCTAMCVRDSHTCSHSLNRPAHAADRDTQQIIPSQLAVPFHSSHFTISCMLTSTTYATSVHPTKSTQPQFKIEVDLLGCNYMLFKLCRPPLHPQDHAEADTP